MLYSKVTSQVLSPTQEKELVKQVAKMGESGRPVIFNRHFFTLVRECNLLPDKKKIIAYSITQEIDRQHEHNFEWINFVREPVSRLVIGGIINLLEEHFILGVNVPLPEET